MFPSFVMRPFVLQLPPTTHLIRTHPLCALQLHGACSALGIHAARALLVSRPRPWPRPAMVHALLASRCRRGFLHARTQKNRGPDPYDELVRCLIEIPSKSLHIHQTTKTSTKKTQALTVMKNYTIDFSKEASSKMFTFVYTPST